MKILETDLPGVLLVEPRVFRDDRGYFLETWNRRRYEGAGLPADFAQDNLSCSARGVLRGLHYQHPRAQGKLVSVLRGSAFDVAVDIRVGSPTFGRWAGFELSAENARQLYIPPGFAHGFLALADATLFSYKCTELYYPEDDAGLLYDDPDIGILWPSDVSLLLSPKDASAPRLADAPPDRLPRFDPAA